ncbi:hypothetical protein [Parasphingorhabdus sp.]|uniref:hypothetical protein n=1 Tax=Parasphingorhabdus sp. TaxID=2709688 RepID=UPI00326421E0
MAIPDPAMVPTEPVSANVCAQMVESATRSCQPLFQIPPEPVNSTADSLAMLSTAFTFGSIILAIIAVIAGFAWSKVVAYKAEEEAKKVAKDCADVYIEDWLAKKAPGIIRSRVDFILDATLGPGDDAKAADDIGKEA